MITANVPVHSFIRSLGRLRPAIVLSGLLLVLSGLACSAVHSSGPPATPTILADPGLPVITFHTNNGGQARLGVEIEATEAARERGLMNVSKLPDDQGQIFIFQDMAPNQDILVSFWMKDTLIPLSIAFISADGHVQEIQDMQAETTDLHTPKQPYRYAVEANFGWYSRHSVIVGSSV